MPAGGADIATFLSYAAEKRAAKRPEEFGHGAIEGVAGPEAANNAAAAGGALTRGKFAPSLQGVEEKYIYEAMETGPQNMPVFSDSNIKPEDKRDIIAYLKTIENQGSPGGLQLGSLGPVSEGLFIWTAGLALIIGFMVWLTSRSS